MIYRDGARVKILQGKYEGEVGTIYTDNGSVVLVKLKNGEIVKLLRSDIELFDEDTKTDPEVVTLTREKLREAICGVSDPGKYEDYFSDKSKATILSLSAGVIGKELERYFFGEVEND